MTGDALLSALRTFGPGGATIAQLRERLGVGAEDLDIGLKVLRETNRVVILDRRLMITGPALRTSMDSPQMKPPKPPQEPRLARWTAPIPDDHLRCYACNKIKPKDDFYGDNGRCIACGNKARARYRTTLTLSKVQEQPDAA